jgi:hypothetical protein
MHTGRKESKGWPRIPSKDKQQRTFWNPVGLNFAVGDESSDLIMDDADDSAFAAIIRRLFRSPEDRTIDREPEKKESDFLKRKKNI